MHDLLMDRLIGVATENGADAQVSLPGLMALMMRNEVGSIPAMRTHQRQGMHSFLVQLGTMAMLAVGRDDPPRLEDEWRTALLMLTQEDHGPWTLIVPDRMLPAFMQMPARDEARLADFQKNPLDTPGQMDIVVTSKNHTMKQHQVLNAQPQDWFMALVSMQTMENSFGQGHKGVSRIRDGTASRVALSLMPPGMRFGEEVRRDILALLEKLPEIRAQHPWYPERGGIRLLWTEPWDGTEPESLPRDALDILYIDVAKRVRLSAQPNGGIRGAYALSDKPRVQREPQGGITGDPWAPVDLKNNQVLKLAGEPDDPKTGLYAKGLQPSEGFSYRNLIQLMFSEDWKRPPLLDPASWELEIPGPMRLVGRCIPRYQGKTFGYLERQVPMTPRFQEVLYSEVARREAGEVALERVAQVASLQGGLSWVIKIYLNGGKPMDPKSKLPEEVKRIINRAVRKLESAVDRSFFENLQVEMEVFPGEREQVRHEWFTRQGDGLFEEARHALHDTIQDHPVGNRQQHRAAARAVGALEGWLRSDKGFPKMFPHDERAENGQEEEDGNGAPEEFQDRREE